jgi:hypothetical protein
MLAAADICRLCRVCNQCPARLAVYVAVVIHGPAAVPTRSVKALHVSLSQPDCWWHGVQLPAQTAAGRWCWSYAPPHNLVKRPMQEPCVPRLYCAHTRAAGCTHHHGGATKQQTCFCLWKAVRCMHESGDMPVTPLAPVLLPMHRHELQSPKTVADACIEPHIQQRLPLLLAATLRSVGRLLETRQLPPPADFSAATALPQPHNRSVHERKPQYY